MSDQETQHDESDGERKSESRGVEIFGRKLPLPANRGWRIALGSGLVVGGLLGFLPILGFWMIPLGLLVLSVDLIFVRRWRRRTTVKWGRTRSTRDASRAGKPTRNPPTNQPS